MKQEKINHRRITAIVTNEIGGAIKRARDLWEEERHNPGSELAKALRLNVIPGIEFDNTGGIARVYVTINDKILSLVGYDGNLSGFLADYFGHDFKQVDGEPLRFRYVDGYLINPSRVK